mgnify:CR=1 FL=1
MCINSLPQDPKYYDFPKINMYLCLVHKYNVNVDSQLVACKTNTLLTISETEACMEDIFKNNVMGWNQGKYVSLRKIAKPKVIVEEYRYDSNITLAQI